MTTRVLPDLARGGVLLGIDHPGPAHPVIFGARTRMGAPFKRKALPAKLAADFTVV